MQSNGMGHIWDTEDAQEVINAEYQKGSCLGY